MCNTNVDSVRFRLESNFSLAMSHAKSAGTYHCEHCDANLTPAEAITPNASNEFCDLECYYRYKGANVIRQICNDHRWCGSCFSRRKTISEPPEWFLQQRPRAIQDAIVGFEYYTSAVTKEHGFAYCECGNVEHFSENQFLRDLDPKTAVTNLAALLGTYYTENQIPEKPDAKALVETITESEDYALAIGRSVFE